ncbi:MAG: hypothetical protein OEZ22_11985 [Spirochaetia bacterium]|nr:hypothetical protein [Spirochaetia bacterium]
MKKYFFRNLLLIIFLINATIWSTENTSGHIIEKDKELAKKEEISWLISTELSVPLTGSIGITLGKPLTDKLIISNFLYYFDRDWMKLLKKGDWHSNSVFVGLTFSYFPFSNSGEYNGYFVGGDFGLSISNQTYRPLNKSDVFFFPFLELYFCGYSMPLWQELDLVLLLGAGWADVSSQVNIDGHINSGDYYPIINARLSYKW